MSIRTVGVGVVVAAVTLGMVGLSTQAAATVEKVVVCHAAGRVGTTQYVTLEVPPNEGGFPQGHFTEGGTTEAGHEDDYLGVCVEDTTTTESTTTTTGSTTTTEEATTTTTETTTTTTGSTTTTEDTTTTTGSKKTPRSDDPTTTAVPYDPTTTTIVTTTIPVLPFTGPEDIALYAGWAISLLSLGGLILLTAKGKG